MVRGPARGLAGRAAVPRGYEGQRHHALHQHGSPRIASPKVDSNMKDLCHHQQPQREGSPRCDAVIVGSKMGAVIKHFKLDKVGKEEPLSSIGCYITSTAMQPYALKW